MTHPVKAKSEILSAHYADQRSALVLHADLDRGWRRLRKTFGFFTNVLVNFSLDLTIRAQVCVEIQPATFDASESNFIDEDRDWGDGWISYSLHARKLVVKVPFDPERLRLMSTGNLGYYVEELSFMRKPPRWYDMRLWITFRGPIKPKPPDVRDWVRRFFPGGLPSLGKRKP